ncbi:MAG TPA: GNAT family N-acetyltransferase [Candidatus Baltobacteraceae bacterium]|nr:GNAT family N-acetyltransferase [Candidatus Baltobacteraceae bacterium]
MVTVELFDINDAARLERAVAIRQRVFVEEQGVPPEIEIDDHDRSDGAAVHALALAGAEPVGAGRFYVVAPGAIQIGRMAVLPDSRGLGVGKALLAALLAEARRRGFREARLHAQVHAAGFYREAGFNDDGPELWDAGILHQPMAKKI